MPEQAKLVRPWSGLDFQILKYCISQYIFSWAEAANTTQRSGGDSWLWAKTISMALCLVSTPGNSANMNSILPLKQTNNIYFFNYRQTKLSSTQEWLHISVVWSDQWKVCWKRHSQIFLRQVFLVCHKISEVIYNVKLSLNLPIYVLYNSKIFVFITWQI